MFFIGFRSMSYLSDMMPTINHMEPERGFEPGSTGYKATALPFELSSIDKTLLFFNTKINLETSLVKLWDAKCINFKLLIHYVLVLLRSEPVLNSITHFRDLCPPPLENLQSLPTFLLKFLRMPMITKVVDQ